MLGFTTEPIEKSGYYAGVEVPAPVTDALTVGMVVTREELSRDDSRSEEHTSELQSQAYLVRRLLLEKKNKRYDLCHRSFSYSYCASSFSSSSISPASRSHPFILLTLPPSSRLPHPIARTPFLRL